MKYYRLTDPLNFNDIIMETDDGKWFGYSYGAEKWVETSIMVRYEWPGDIFYNKYVMVTDEDAMGIISKNRNALLNQLSIAEKTAQKAHEGQLDKGGNPYINHPVYVANSLQNLEHKIVALLHDVCEDSNLTVDDLLNLGFSKRISHSVSVLTRDKRASYDDYLAEIKIDTNARTVKIADIKHNMQISRIPEPTEDDYARLEKYEKALIYLGA